MTAEIASIVSSVLVMVGLIVAGGAIYSGLEKLAKAFEKKN